VPLDDLRADEQPETTARDTADRARAIAALEHERLLLLRNADAAIPDRDDRLGSVDAHVDVDIASIRRVLDGIANEVLEHALNAMVIEVGHERNGRRCVAKRMALREHFHLIDRHSDGIPQVAARQIQLDGVAIDRAKIGEHLDQVRRL
jgi:hypothetical protein